MKRIAILLLSVVIIVFFAIKKFDAPEESIIKKNLSRNSKQNVSSNDIIKEEGCDSIFNEDSDVLKVPEDIKKNITSIRVLYYGFDSLDHYGCLIVNKKLENEVRLIFEELYKNKFPIEKIIPISDYGWSDSLSMLANNTSGFNYRTINGSEGLSDHAFGRAIDINPFQNPYIPYKTKITIPIGSSYDTSKVGTITSNSIVVDIFKRYGWKWGGDWKYTKDYQHFYKKISKD